MLKPVTGLTLMTVFMVISSRPSPGPMMTTSKRFSQAWICSVRSCTMASKDTRCACRTVRQQAALPLSNFLGLENSAIKDVNIPALYIMAMQQMSLDVVANKTIPNPVQMLNNTANHVLYCMLCS